MFGVNESQQTLISNKTIPTVELGLSSSVVASAEDSPKQNPAAPAHNRNAAR
jgi:hypothetical protein